MNWYVDLSPAIVGYRFPSLSIPICTLHILQQVWCVILLPVHVCEICPFFCWDLQVYTFTISRVNSRSRSECFAKSWYQQSCLKQECLMHLVTGSLKKARRHSVVIAQETHNVATALGESRNVSQSIIQLLDAMKIIFPQLRFTFTE